MFGYPADAFNLFQAKRLCELYAASLSPRPANRAQRLDLGKARQRGCADTRWFGQLQAAAQPRHILDFAACRAVGHHQARGKARLKPVHASVAELAECALNAHVQRVTDLGEGLVDKRFRPMEKRKTKTPPGGGTGRGSDSPHRLLGGFSRTRFQALKGPENLMA